MDSQIERQILSELSTLKTEMATLRANQEHLGDQMIKVLELLDRMVRVEEHQEADREKIIHLEATVKRLEDELNQWKAIRHLSMWLAGILVTIAGYFHFTSNGGGK